MPARYRNEIANRYQIHGYDSLFGDRYVKSDTYADKAEAQRLCRVNEWVQPAAPSKP